MGNGIVDGSIDLSFQFQVAPRILSGLVAWGAKVTFPEKLGNKLIHIYFICFDLIECINEILMFLTELKKQAGRKIGKFLELTGACPFLSDICIRFF